VAVENWQAAETKSYTFLARDSLSLSLSLSYRSLSTTSHSYPPSLSLSLTAAQPHYLATENKVM
jgi:hypothetical protein